MRRVRGGGRRGARRGRAARAARLGAFGTLLLGAACGGGREPLRASTAELPHTTIVAGLAAPLDPAFNTLWCGTAPLAWRALEGALRAELAVEGAPPSATQLAASRFTARDVDPGAIFVAAGRASDGVVERIQGEVERRFGEDDPALDADAQRDDLALVAYARLEKELPFETAFEDFAGAPLAFHFGRGSEVRVDAFGIGHFDHDEKRHRELAKEVRVLAYESPESFVVELVPRGERDRILVARLAPAETLGATWEAVRARLEPKDGAAREGERLRGGDVLAIPELDLDLEHVFSDLVGRHLATPGLEALYFIDARERLRLRLDEEGMVVKSRTRFAVGAAMEPRPRRLVCDGPFLLAAIERDAAEPYLVAWIAHPELLLAEPQDG